MKAFSHRFISLVPRCYILPHELYPLMKTKYVVPTQISILIQWQSLLQLSHPSLLYCWTCYCPQYNSSTAPWTFNNHSSYIFPSFGQFEREKIDFFSFLMACKQMLRKWSSLVSNATFNNISVISWRSVLLVEGTRGSVENNLNGWWQLIMKERYMMNDCWTFREVVII
jgi:hypothetical protein